MVTGAREIESKIAASKLAEKEFDACEMQNEVLLILPGKITAAALLANR